MKKIFFILLIFVLVVLIYKNNIDNKIYYLALGDSYSLGINNYNIHDYGYTDYIKDYLIEAEMLENYVNVFSKKNYRTVDLLRDIEMNKSFENAQDEISIQQALIKADLVTLSIGTNDLINMSSLSLDNNYIYDAMSDMDMLLGKLREFCKEKIIAVGYFNLNDNYKYANKIYKELCEKYGIIYIDVYDLIENNEYFSNPNDIYPTKEGYKFIANKIIDVLNF